MHKIAIIPGDGIGQEVVPAALEVIERAAPQVLQMTEFPWGCEFYLRNGRMMDRGRVRSAAAVRGDLPRRDRRPARAGSHLGLGADPAAPPALRSVRQSAADAAAARRRHAARGPDDGRHRHGLRARELRRGVRRARRAPARRHAARGGRADRPLHAARHRADRALRVRGGVQAAAPQARQRDQVQRAAALDGAVGQGRRGGREGLSGRSSGASTTSTRWPRGWSPTRRAST